MNFWDYFIFRIYATFTDVPPGLRQQGLQAGCRILDAAYARGLFSLATTSALISRLSDESISILAFLQPPNLGPVAQTEHSNRGLPLPPAVPAVVVPADRDHLVLFLSRLYLDDAATRGWNEQQLLNWVTGVYARGGPTTFGSLPCYLYRCLFAPPSALPSFPDPTSPMPPSHFPT